ncbi:MAG: cupin domain-containing protein [Inquilinaceae bacterium]
MESKQARSPSRPAACERGSPQRDGARAEERSGPPPEDTGDALSAVLARLDLGAAVFFTGALRGVSDHGVAGGGAAGGQEPDPPGADGPSTLHVLRGGVLTVTEPGRPPERIAEPSLIFFSGPAPHRIAATGAAGADLVCARVELGGLAGVGGSAGGGGPGLGFPPRLVLPLASLPGLDATLTLLFDEAFARRPGHRAAVDRLVELLVVLLLRHCAETGLIGPGVLAALGHPGLARALKAMHEGPARPWTLETLAEEAGMSRAGFAARFKATLDTTPGAYLTALRLALAQRALRAGRPLKTAAAEAGYASPTALARLFQQKLGQSPRAWLAGTRGAGRVG